MMSSTPNAVSAVSKKCKLVWITPNSEQLIAQIARVSNPKNQYSHTYKGLLKYLVRNKHWSPFEMANMTIEINTTRAIASQILRHRSFSFQEFSQRYADVDLISDPDSYKLNIRRQDQQNRQNSIDDFDDDTKQYFQDKFNEINIRSLYLYQEMLSANVAKECARFVLPLNSPTRLYMNGTIRSWIHYLQLRSENGTQLEHMDIANDIIENIFKKELPTVYEVCFEKNE